MTGTSIAIDACLTRPEFVAWGESLGRQLVAPTVLALHGELGAGKTTLVQAICRGYGVMDEVTSPTYALVHEYHAPASAVHHLDLYRLDGPRDLTNLGFDDLLATGSVMIIEWPERAGDRLPQQRLDIWLAHVPGDGERRRVRAA